MNKHGRMGTKMSRCLFQVFALLRALAASSAPASSLYFVHTDHLGTPQKITDGAQQVVWEGSPMPFGETEVVVNQIDFHVRFPGQYFDSEAGLHYNYFRDYDPSLGRYLESDPIGLRGGINTFSYVRGSPIVLIDPKGLDSSANLGDAAGAFRDGGYSGYAESVQAMQDATSAAQSVLSDNMSLLEKNNSLSMGPADAIRHCVLACSLTRRLGLATAKSILNRHEQRSGDKDLMDEWNNMMGCFIGEKSPGDCQAECLKNFDDLATYHDGDGRLMGRPKPIGEIK